MYNRIEFQTAYDFKKIKSILISEAKNCETKPNFKYVNNGRISVDQCCINSR